MGPVRRKFGVEGGARRSHAAPVWLLFATAALVLALGCAGCGSAINTSTAVGGDSSGASAAGLALNTARGQPTAGLRVVAVGHIAQPLTHTARAFAQMADTVCQVVRQGAPKTLSRPLTRPRIARYVKAADAAAARTVVSLRRLAGQRHSRTLVTLAEAYASLRALYASAGRVAKRRLARRTAENIGEQIKISEHLLTTAAFDAGMPACGVNGA